MLINLHLVECLKLKNFTIVTANTIYFRYLNISIPFLDPNGAFTQ